MNEKILLLGSGSFIGQHLAAHLARQDVAVVQVRHRRECNIANAHAISDFISRTSPTRLLHMAATPDSKTALWRAQGEFVNTVRCAWNVRHAIQRLPHGRIVHLGSYKQYGNIPIPFRETARAKPRSAYGLAKHIAEYLIKTHSNPRVETVSLRFGPVYGAGQGRQYLIAHTIHALRQPITKRLAALEVEWDPLYIDDAVDALMRTLFEPRAAGHIINLSGGQATSPYQVMNELRILLRRDDVQIERLPFAPNSYRCLGDISRAAQLLAWAPRVSLSEGLRVTLEQTLLNV